jgi:alpha-glucuronidase
MAEVCKSLGKTFFVRTFSYKPDELEYICGGLKECKSDIIVMSKCQPHDWQPYYPHNPAIGNIGNHPQIVEFDLGYEFLGISRVPYIDLNYLKNRLDYGISKGIVGGIIRIERYKWWAWGTPNWANVDIFSKMLLDPSIDQQAMFRDWIASRYGEEAAPYVVSAFSRTFDIVNKSYFALGFWYTDHSFLQDYRITRDSLWLWSSGKWDKRKKLLEACLLTPTPLILSRVREEKNQAVRMADMSLADIDKAKPYLSPADYAELRHYMVREKAMAEVWRAHAITFFTTRMAEQKKDADMKKQALESAQQLRTLVKQYERELVEIASDYAIKDNKANLKGTDGLASKAEEVSRM